MQADKASSEPMETKAEEQSIGALLSNLGQDIRTLVRQEVQLARAEVSEKTSQVGSGIVSIAVGGVVVFAGIFVLLQAAIYGLHDAIEAWSPGLWVPALIIGVIVAIVGYVLLQKGRRNLQPASLAPQRTVSTLREDKEFAKGRM
jgi:hypothetical protein